MKKQTALILTCVTLLGCQSAGRRLQTAFQTPETTEVTVSETTPTERSEAPDRGFSLRRVLQFAGFDRSAEGETSLVPREVVQLSDMVDATVEKASQLSVNDPPEVTRQKAQGILASLSSWDGALAAGRSLGVVNDKTAQVLNGFVAQLRAETQKLVQQGANPETIAAVQHLAGNLKATAGNMAAIFSEGTEAYRSLVGPRTASAQPAGRQGQ